MEESQNEWSSAEKKLAREVFDRAYEREIAALVKDVRMKSSTLEAIDDLWQLHDFLSAKRHEIDGKYDYRYSVLLFVFARLIRDGWLDLYELEQLTTDKLSKIKALTRM